MYPEQTMQCGYRLANPRQATLCSHNLNGPSIGDLLCLNQSNLNYTSLVADGQHHLIQEKPFKVVRIGEYLVTLMPGPVHPEPGKPSGWLR